MAPVLLALAVAAATVVTFLLWSTAELDHATLARERELARRVVGAETRRIANDQLSVTLSDDAVVHTRFGLDRDWVAANLGQRMYAHFGHNRTFVLDTTSRPLFAMDQGQTAASDLYFADADAYSPIVERLRGRLASHALMQDASADRPADLQQVEVALVAGSPAIVSVAAIVSASGRLLQHPGTEFLHISVAYLDSVFADRLADEHLFTEATFTRYPSRSSERGVLPVLAMSGRIIGFFEWTPERPGARMLARTMIALGGISAFGVLLIVLLLYRLWRSSSDLEKGRLMAQHQAHHDSLTGLPNRSRFDEMLARTLAAPRNRREGVALLLLDLDRFKQVNDTLGHQSGDELIRAVGQRLQRLVGPNDTIARLGGDEFGIIHHAVTGLAGHLQLSGNIIEAVGKPFELDGGEAFVGVSIGVVEIEERDQNRREIVRKADIALYEAKSSGRNCAVAYEEAMDELLQNRHRIEADLRDALRSGDQLTVAFQPLYSGQTGQILGAEALARWNHPRLGPVSPALFIPVAEGTGLIEPIGEFVLRRACELGAQHPGLTFAVNISPAQLRNPRFPERLFDLLLQTGMAAADLEIEITESILLDHEDVATATLRTLRGAGIRIALDDFGTGYSSLNYLKRYPVDRIKVDRSFVSQLEEGSVSAAIVQAMVTLAHALDIQVTAEGVETVEQHGLLCSMCCNTLQGFLLSPPLPETGLVALLQAQGGSAGADTAAA